MRLLRPGRILGVLLPALLAGGPLWAGPVITGIRVEGQDKIGVDAIRYRLAHPVGRELDRRMVSEDIKSIFQMGYFESVEAGVEPGLDAAEAQLVYAVREKPTLHSVKLEGFEEFEEAKLKEVLKLKEREIYSESKLAESIRAIRDKYAEEGFYLTRVEPVVEQRPNNTVDLTLQIIEGDKVRVRRLLFTGNRAFGDEELKDALSDFQGHSEGSIWSFITSSGKFNEALVERDTQILKQFYLEQGYKDITVDPGEVEITPDLKEIYIAYRIEEGDQYFVKSLDVSGEVIYEQDALKESLALKPGGVFNQKLLRDDLERLTNLYSDKGFAFVDVEPRIIYDDEANTAAVEYHVARGDLVYFDKFHITGNEKTYDRVIRRVLSIEEGQLYNGVGLNESRRRVQSLSFFKEVNFLTEPNEDRSGMDVKISVVEGPTGSLNLGVGYSSIDRFIGNAQISQGNLFGSGQTVRLAGEFGARRKRFNIYYNEPYLFDSYWSFQGRLFSEERILPNYTRTSNGGSLGVGYRITFNTTFGANYSFQDTRTDLSGSSGSFVGSTDDKIGSIGFNLDRDTKNHAFDPTEGTKIGAGVDFAAKTFGGDTEFAKFNAYARAFYNPVWKWVLSAGVEANYATTFDQSELPFSQRFFTGGIYSVRGYQYGSLGPRREIPTSLAPDFETASREAGGNKELVFNAESLFPIVEEVGIKGVFFYDAGNVFLESDPYDIRELRQGWGFGFRWFSPLGPLRFEWGYPIRRQPGERASVFEFTIGTFF